MITTPPIPPPSANVEAENIREKAFRESCNFPLRHCETSVRNVARWHELKADIFEALRKPGAIVVVVGPRGGGKTQAATEIGREFHSRHAFPLYRTALEFFYLLRATFGTDTPESVQMAKHCSPALLVMDEIQVRGETSFELDRLTYLVDARYRTNRRTLLISNLPTKAKANGGPCIEANLGASICSRIQETGAVIEFDHPSFRAVKS